jgi:hypothetical protein
MLRTRRHTESQEGPRHFGCGPFVFGAMLMQVGLSGSVCIDEFEHAVAKLKPADTR